MNNEEIRKELIRIIKGSYQNDYMWYYDKDEFPVLDSLIDLINTISAPHNKRLTHDIYDLEQFLTHYKEREP